MGSPPAGCVCTGTPPLYPALPGRPDLCAPVEISAGVTLTEIEAKTCLTQDLAVEIDAIPLFASDHPVQDRQSKVRQNRAWATFRDASTQSSGWR